MLIIRLVVTFRYSSTVAIRTILFREVDFTRRGISLNCHLVVSAETERYQDTSITQKLISRIWSREKSGSNSGNRARQTFRLFNDEMPVSKPPSRSASSNILAHKNRKLAEKSARKEGYFRRNVEVSSAMERCLITPFKHLGGWLLIDRADRMCRQREITRLQVRCCEAFVFTLLAFSLRLDGAK